MRIGLIEATIVVAAGAALAGCASQAAPDASFGDRVLAVAAKGAVNGAKFGRDMVEVALVRLPELLFWKIPHALLAELPRAIYLAVAPTESRVAGLIGDVRADGDAEAVAAAIERLRDETGLPFTDAAAWLAWWETARDVPASRWLPAFVDAQIHDLDDEDYLVRDAADARLRELSGIDVGYDAKAPAEERAEGREAWVAWRHERFGDR